MTVIPRSSIVAINLSTWGTEAARPREASVPVPKPSFDQANPVPEVMYPAAKEAGARVVGTGRSDAPNQTNNSSVFPGVFRGALDVRAKKINEEMKLAAAYAIADLIPEKELRDDYVVLNVFDPRVAPAVAAAVAKAAIETDVARVKVDPEEVRRRARALIGR